MQSFFVLALALLTGDDNMAKAVKIHTKGKSAFESELASLRAKRVDLEQNLEDAQEAVGKALVNNGNLIGEASDRARYVRNYVEACNRVVVCEEELEAHDRTVSALEAGYELLKNSKPEDLREAVA